MTKRPEAPSEKALHKKMIEGEVAHRGFKGMLAGTVVGAGLRHLGHAGKGAPLYGAALGTAAGAVSGYHHGKERQLRDTVQQERQHMRSEARTKKSYDEAVWGGFSDELQKTAIFSLVGRGLMNAGLAGAKAVGLGGQASRAMISGMGAAGGRKGLETAVGVGATALGGGYLLGRATAPRQPQGY